MMPVMDVLQLEALKSREATWHIGYYPHRRADAADKLKALRIRWTITSQAL
ncbi:MAG: hypothetical protein IPN74_20125 [Haliscomenobacter sp.]|nr:hypothetical protein [Haliscomenobacter sp.]